MDAPDKLTPTDPRVEHHTFTTRGNTWHYVLGNPPSTTPAGTILLVHGFPDMGFGWRYQVPFLLSLGLRVVVPDMLGFGRTSAPDAVAEYSGKNISADLAALAAHVAGAGQRVILGGHDWGGWAVWRFALWYPDLVQAVFSVCTPYSAPRTEYLSHEDMVNYVPTFKYQLQFASGKTEEGVGPGKDRLRQFLRTLHGGRGPNKEVAFRVAEGVLFDKLDLIGPSPLMSAEEAEFYVEEYARNGLHGALNWYRTTRVNYEEELPLAKEGPERGRIRAPAMMVTASRDAALPPSMAERMERHFDNLTRREVNASHWALWEAAGEVNKAIGDFLGGVLKESKL